MGKLMFGVARILLSGGLFLVLPVLAYANQTIKINSTVRDFRMSHPDFEKGLSGLVKGLVGATLPPDKKPVFVASPGAGAVTNASTFAQWYNDVPNVNWRTTLPLTFTETAPGSGIFDLKVPNFFPIDGVLFGNEGRSHNYHFTLELHTTFTYKPGQVFSFTGDDDMWVYINNRLVVDLGGVHDPVSASVALDTLGLTPGNTYDFDLYFTERHTVSSVFHVQTSIVFDLPSQIKNSDPRLISQPSAYDKLNPPPNAEHLIVIIHGWQPEGEKYNLNVENKMKSSIEKIIAEKRPLEKEKWYVKVWDWRTQAGPCFFEVFALDLCPNTAYYNATVQADALSAEIKKYSFKDVHFIAHSAGSNVVQTAIGKLKGQSRPIFHATFLDAYAPSVDKLVYGKDINYAEHYVDKRGNIPWFSNTNKDLTNAYTFDVTKLDETQFPPDYEIANPAPYLQHVHGWPTAWYQESIDSQGTGAPFKYGFGLSRENGLNTLPTEYAPPGTCQLLSDNDLCATNIRQDILQPIFEGTKINPILASQNGQTRQSSSGSVSYSDTGVIASTGSPVWFEIYETTTNVANFMQFDLQFLSAAGAEGIMTVFIDGEPVYKIDERITEPGDNVEGIWVGDLDPGRHSIGFRLDPFTAVQSVARISHIELGQVVNKPVFVYPADGQRLDYKGSYLFKVEPIASAQGFLWGFFQNGLMVWENLRDQGTLSTNEYGIHPGTPAYSKFVPGSVQVWVRALIAGQWTDAAIITIYLQ